MIGMQPEDRPATARRGAEVLGVLLACLLAACLYTWPLVTDLSGSTLAGRFQMSHAWAMETVNDGLRGTSPHVRLYLDPTAEEAPGGVARKGLLVHTTGINWPGGGEIVFLAWFNLLLGSLLRTWLPYLAAFNLGVLVVLALAPWAAWLLARRLGASRGAAGLAALVYGFSPYVGGVVHNGQLAKYNHAWLALLALCTWELLGARRRAWLAVPLTAVVATIALASSPYLFVFGSLGCAVLALWRLGGLPGWGARGLALLRSALAGGLALVLARPWIHHYAAREASILSPSTPGEDTARREIAAGLAHLLGPTSCPVPAELPQTEELHVAYLGLVALALAAAGTAAAAARGERGAAADPSLHRSWRRLLPWWGLVLLFSLLAMGREASLGEQVVTLPLGWLVAVLPEGRALVFVYRAVAVASLGLAVLVALGTDALSARWPRARPALLVVAALALSVDQLAMAPAAWPMPWRRLDLAPAWGTMMAEPQVYGVLAWPVDHGALDGLPDAQRNAVQALTQELVLEQGWHDKGLGFVDKGNHTRDAYQTGLVQGLARLARGAQPDPRLSVPWSVTWLQEQGFRYLVLHPDLLPESSRAPTEDWLTEQLGPPERWEGSTVLRWRLQAIEQR